MALDTTLERVADVLEGRTADGYASPADVARLLDPTTVQTPALALIDRALIAAADGTGPRRLIISMPPQEGKSQRIGRFFPTWLLKRNPELRIALVGYQDAISRRWGKQIRDDITARPELGLKLQRGSEASNDWKLSGHRGGLNTTSIAGALTGRPVDVMVIDDPHKDAKEAGSETQQINIVEWWRTSASTRMPAGGGIVIVVQTRWNEADLAGYLLSHENPGWRDWAVLNIPAQAEHDPARGPECRCAQRATPTGSEMYCQGFDILGRAPGEYMISARGRSREDWEQRKRDAGTVGWTALYQGWPSPLDGLIFKREWWQLYDRPRWTVLDNGAHHALGATQVILSIDCTFKDTKGTDYVVMGVWARRGAQAWLLDVVRERMDFTETCKQLRALVAKWPQASLKLIEEKANGAAVISALRDTVGGLVPYSPTASKLSRAYAVSPFVEARNIAVPAPELCPWVGAYLAEMAAFPNGSHDDQVDMTSQALERLFLLGGGGGDFLAELEAEARQPGDAHEHGHASHWTTTDHDRAEEGDQGAPVVPIPALASFFS